MPKPKPTEVIVHRLDLQPSVKESMDNFLIGKTFTNTIQAVGGLVDGLGPALAVIAGWFLADKAIDEVLDKITDWADGTAQDVVDERYGSENDKYLFICAMLESSVDLPAWHAQADYTQEILNKGESNFHPVAEAYARFRLAMVSELTAAARRSGRIGSVGGPGVPWEGWGQPLAQRWKSFYPINALMDEIKADVLSLGGQADKMPWPVSWLWKRATNQ